MGLEIREVLGLLIGGVLTLALVAAVISKNNDTAGVASAFANGFATDIKAATFQGGSSSGG
jgi:hypothetical protein